MPARTDEGAWIDGVITVLPAVDVPDRELTRHCTSRVNVRANDHCLLEDALVLPTCAQVELPTGRVQIVTTSPGTAVPVSGWLVFQCAVAGPTTVGGKVARIDTEPVTAAE